MFQTDTTLDILDYVDEIGEMIRNSDEYERYNKYKQLLHTDTECKTLIDQFVKLKEDFEDVARFGRYHPDYKTKKRTIRQQKKAVDLNPVVIEYRRAEYELQNILDEVMFIIGKSISKNANIVSHNPFFSSGESSCMTGGGCNCAS